MPRPLLPLGARVEVCGAEVLPPAARGAWPWEVGAAAPEGLTLWPVPRARRDGSARPPVLLPWAAAVAAGLAELEDGAPERLSAPEAGPVAPPDLPPPPPAAPALGAAGGGLAVAWFNGIDPAPVGGAVMTWPRLRARLTRCPALEAGLDKRSAPGWAPLSWAAGQPHRRKAENVGALSCLVLDCDKLPPDGLDLLEGAAERLGRAACWHTSWSHSTEAPKARLILPFATPCPVAQWPRVWGAGQRWAAAAGLEVDAACRDPGRWYLLPGLPADAAPERWDAVAAGMIEGPPLDWRWFAAAWPPPPPLPLVTPPPRERTRTAAEWADRGRRKALGWFEHRARALACAPPGGQSMACYGNARKVGQAVAGGVLSDGEGEDWCRTFTAAGVAAGLPEARAADSVARGYRKGMGEPWDFLAPEPAG